MTKGRWQSRGRAGGRRAGRKNVFRVGLAVFGVASLLGGILTTYADWRWVLLVNIPVVVAILVGVGVLEEGERERVGIDFPGAITLTLGVGSLIFAVNRVAEHGWTDRTVIALLVAGAVSLAVS